MEPTIIQDEVALKFETSTMPWYVAMTKPRQEKLAQENLLRQGYGVYYPQIKRLKLIRKRQQEQIEAMFPRYLFVQPASEQHSIAPIRSTFGVTSLVRFGQTPAVMQTATLMRIRRFETLQNAADFDELNPFRPGSKVAVVEGPLAGLEGLVSENAKDRVVVLMGLLGQDTRVNLSVHQIVAME
ncbi:MAG TPA: transcriptional activator RfaH [Rhodocyclaceae bacterium]|nr:transcriptional activator RfaH [Rhodocyclaceae bacterium]